MNRRKFLRLLCSLPLAGFLPPETLSSDTASRSRGDQWTAGEMAQMTERAARPHQLNKIYGPPARFDNKNFGVASIRYPGQDAQRHLNMHRSKMLDVICKDRVSF